MCLIVYLEPSCKSANYPGHMVVGQQSAGGAERYYGFRFDPKDLPEEYRDKSRWRDYLFEQAVPGKIEDETNYWVQKRRKGMKVIRRSAVCQSTLDHVLPQPADRKPHAWYSFNPDTPRDGHQPCYNCVKWAAEIANCLVPGFLPRVEQWRVWRMVEELNGAIRDECPPEDRP